MSTTPPVVEQDEPFQLTPLEAEDLGKYASFDVSPFPMFGPDELGSAMKAAVDDMTMAVTKTESAPRIFEVLQAWEARLFDRNYQFNLSTNQGWNMYGASSGPSGILATQNASKLFSCNVYGARKDKITAALSREAPSLRFAPKQPDSSPDQLMADECDKYVDVWKQDTDVKGLCVDIGGLFYTDGRVCLWTRTVADQQRWGTETPDSPDAFGMAYPDGVAPETMNDPMPTSDKPAMAEITTAYGKLEHKVPLTADDENQMGWVRIATEINVNIAKERYSWIEDSITAGAGLSTGNDQFDRLARINVRLAVQNSTVSGDSWMSDTTESHTWFRPSQYRAIKDRGVRQQFYDNFPDGLRTTHVGPELAFVRNESLNDHIKIVHSRHGSGQNRRAIGSNYLPLQKVLNTNISLLNRYFVACVPRRFHQSEKIASEAMNGQRSDPSLSTPILLDPGQSIGDVTGIEAVPQPTTGLMEFVQWLVEGAPEIMDGGSPAMFGGTDGTDTVGGITIQRDQVLQVFATPWSQICWALAKAVEQAAQSAARNRVTNVRSKIPGADRLTVEIGKMKGEALCYPESVEIPETLAEQEKRMMDMIEKSSEIPLLQQIVSDPRNLIPFKSIARFAGVTMPGVDAVEKQQGEFELLLKSGPIDNPMLLEMQQAMQTIEMQMMQDPNAQTDGAQQQFQQAQQAVAQLPPKVSSVPVAQDSSENHEIEAAICWDMLNSENGRKLANGTPDEQLVFQNLKLHWQGHEEMKQKLTPVPPLPVKASATVAIDKLPPNVQAQALQAMGVQAQPEDFEGQDMLIPHEVTTEKEGVDASGTPVKQKISMASPGMKS